MKALKYIFIGLVVIVVLALVGVYIFIKTFDINRYRPQIIAEATKALGRPVDIKNLQLKVSLPYGIVLGVEGLTVADLPQFRSGQLLKIDSIEVGVDIQAYLNNKTIRVTNVRIISPQVTVVRTKEGQVNLQSLAPQTSQKEGTPASSPSLSPSSLSAQTSPPGPLTSSKPGLPQPPPVNAPAVVDINSLVVDSLSVTNGVVFFTDKSFAPELALSISKVTVNVEKFSLVTPFHFKVKASFLSPVENVLIEGWAQLNIQEQRVHLKDIKISTDAANLSLSEVKKTFSAFLKGVSLPEEVKGNLNASIKEAILGAKGIESLALDGAIADGSVKLKELGVPISGIKANLNATSSVITLKDFLCKIGSGLVRANGVINDYLGTPNFSITKSLEAIDLSQVVNQKDLPVKMQGQLFGQFTAQGQGIAADALLKSLKGDGIINLKDGKLVDMNVLKTVLSKMSMLPNLVDKIESNLPERYKEILKQKDTLLKKVEMDASIEGGAIKLNKAQVQAEGFSLIGNGTVDFDENLNMGWSLVVEKDLSASMVAAVKELQYIIGEDGQIQIPVHVSGKTTAPVVLPDMEYLSKRIIANRGQQELNKVLDKVFGGGESSQGQPTNPSDNNQTPPDGQKKHPERKMIEDLLKSILK